MLITRTPLRISFLGGGTDYPVWYEQNGGAVISVTIDKYSYIVCRFLPPFFNFNYRIRYSTYEDVISINEVRHPSVRECLRFCNLPRGVEMQYNGDLPAMSGLGSSSAFTVGFLKALRALKGDEISPYKLACDAIHVEQNMIRENVGSQDQTAAAFGGFNKIEFGGEEKVKVIPLSMDFPAIKELEKHLMLFFTGFQRTASEIAGEQIQNTPNKFTELSQMRCMVVEAERILKGDVSGIDDFGRLLHEGWLIKRGLSSKITNSSIDEIYAAARSTGAIGGKILGAGGGGFMLLFVHPENQQRVREKLKHLLYVPFKFENSGSQVIYRMEEE